MKGSNKNGFALIGVLIAVFIIAGIFYMIYLKGNKNENKNIPEGIKTDLPSVKKEMNDLQKKIDERNARDMEILNDTGKKATTTK